MVINIFLKKYNLNYNRKEIRNYLDLSLKDFIEFDVKIKNLYLTIKKDSIEYHQLKSLDETLSLIKEVYNDYYADIQSKMNTLSKLVNFYSGKDRYLDLNEYAINYMEAKTYHLYSLLRAQSPFYRKLNNLYFEQLDMIEKYEMFYNPKNLVIDSDSDSDSDEEEDISKEELLDMKPSDFKDLDKGWEQASNKVMSEADEFIPRGRSRDVTINNSDRDSSVHHRTDKSPARTPSAPTLATHLDLPKIVTSELTLEEEPLNTPEDLKEVNPESPVNKIKKVSSFNNFFKTIKNYLSPILSPSDESSYYKEDRTPSATDQHNLVDNSANNSKTIVKSKSLPNFKK